MPPMPAIQQQQQQAPQKPAGAQAAGPPKLLARPPPPAGSVPAGAAAAAGAAAGVIPELSGRTPSPGTVTVAGRGGGGGGPPVPGAGGRMGPPHWQQQQQGGSYQQQQYGSYQQHQHRRHRGGVMMTADEIDFILRIQYAATHSGSAYIEDYYHQAYVHKYFRGRNANGRFAPDIIRNLDGTEADVHSSQSSVTVDVGALGRLVLSNIRTPKPLMDLRSGPAGGAGKGSAAAQGGSGDEGQGAGGQRPLDQEPLLAARIMIEDCMNLIMDVDDVDRLLALETATSANAANLHARRAVLLEGISGAFQLPQDALGQAADEVRGDAVFLQVLALSKGRTLLAKTLLRMFTGSAAAVGQKQQQQLQNGSSRVAGAVQPGLPLMWALLRNAHTLFNLGIDAAAAAKAEKRLVDSTSQLAAAAAEVVKRLQQPMDAIECLTAFNASVAKAAAAAGEGGDGVLQLLPLFPARVAAADGNPDWLGTVLAALLLRASELGLGSFALQGTVVSLGKGQEDEDEIMAAADEGSVGQQYDPMWQERLGVLFEALLRHLAGVYSIVKGGNLVWGAEGKEAAKKLSGVPVVRGMMAHCSSQQQEQLRTYLSELSH